MDVYCIIIGIVIMIFLARREKEYFKQYKLYGGVAVTYIITVFIMYLVGKSTISRPY